MKSALAAEIISASQSGPVFDKRGGSVFYDGVEITVEIQLFSFQFQYFCFSYSTYFFGLLFIIGANLLVRLREKGTELVI